ncbi:hypothetical protein [Streptomyces sp. NPDC020983]|uniref:hypothetical protein n=1 Tax=Streptomyces sp. NPDC020983 TaxID=3365106 RepID=UPI0037A67C46
MKWLRSFVMFWYDFVVGDDWRVAAGVTVALGATAALVHGAGVDAWWLPPVAVAVLLALSLRRAVAAARR